MLNGLLLIATTSSDGGSLDLGPLLMGLLGGLALFLYGMDKMADALKAVAGDRMKAILEKLTSNRVMGAMTGAFITAVIQSSSVTTVMLVGFITAGLISFAQSVPVIMGANIGTTFTAQIIAFKVTKFASLLIAVGFGMSLFSSKERVRQHGAGIMGLGLIFFGMAVMGEAMHPLRSHPPFLEWMTHMASPVIGILAGAVFTALVQSSSATTGVVIVMASQGFITLPAGIALIFGANVGTCVTALLAAIGKPREALRAAVVHVMFNLVGVLLWLPFIDHLAEFVTLISPSSSELGSVARLAADTPRQIANAHSVFNVINTVLLMGLTSQAARLVQWMLPDKPVGLDELVRARYLDVALLSTPSLALDRVRLEVLHVGDEARAMMRDVMPALLTGGRESLVAVSLMDDRIDALHAQIVHYLGKVSQESLSEAQTEELLKLLEAVNDLENIGDIIETNLVSLGLERAAGNFAISEATRAVLTQFHTTVSQAVELAIQAVTQKSSEAAGLVVDMKSEINRMERAAAKHQAERLVVEAPDRLPTYRLETDVLQNLKRIYYFAKRMARAATPPVALNENS